ncbi:MAG: Mut7-C RNAse domain-containing protein [Desulfobaccales bacterium]
MKFLVDQPLGGLAKWLRFCGFDAAPVRLAADQPQGWPPPRPQTHILTRQTNCARLKRPDLLVLTADEPEAQLEEVMRRLHISPRHLTPLSRCSHCNEPLIPLDRDLVQGRVPEHVFHYQRQFSECPRCHRVYWPGSHIRGITKTLREKLEKLATET